MYKFEFNRNEFNWAEEFYEIIKTKMSLPDWFGRNADALWDMLTGYIELPCEVSFINFGEEKKEYNKQIIEKIIKCFLDAEKQYPNMFKINFIGCK